MLVHEWPRIVGPAVAAHTRAEKVERGVLVVRVESNVWATELSTRVPVLLERIRDAVGEGLVTDLRFVTGRAARPGPGGGRFSSGASGSGARGPQSADRGWPDRRDLEAVPLSEADRRLVEEFRAAQKDPAVARAGTRWLTATLKARRWLREAGRRWEERES